MSDSQALRDIFITLDKTIFLREEILESRNSEIALKNVSINRPYSRSSSDDKDIRVDTALRDLKDV